MPEMTPEIDEAVLMLASQLDEDDYAAWMMVGVHLVHRKKRAIERILGQVQTDWEARGS